MTFFQVSLIPVARLAVEIEDVAAGTTLILTDLEALLKLDVDPEVAVMVTLPTFFAVTFPVEASTIAMVLSEDLKDLLPLAPERETVAVFPTAIEEAVVLAVMI